MISRLWLRYRRNLALGVLLLAIPSACRNTSRVNDRQLHDSDRASDQNGVPKVGADKPKSAEPHPSQQDILVKTSNIFDGIGVGEALGLSPQDFQMALESKGPDPDGKEIEDAEAVGTSDLTEDELLAKEEKDKSDPRLTPNTPSKPVSSVGIPAAPEEDSMLPNADELKGTATQDAGTIDVSAPTDDLHRYQRRLLSADVGALSTAKSRPNRLANGEDAANRSSNYNTSILFSGLVRDSGGVRLSGATVHLYSRLNANYNWTSEDYGSTNSSGYYEVLFERDYFTSDMPVIRDYRICGYDYYNPETCRQYELRLNYTGDYSYEVQDIYLNGSSNGESLNIAFYGIAKSGSASGVPVSGGTVALYSRASSVYGWQTEGTSTTSTSGYFSLSFARDLGAASFPYTRSYSVCLSHPLHQTTCSEVRLQVSTPGSYTYEIGNLFPAYIPPSPPSLLAPLSEGDLAPRFIWTASPASISYEFILRETTNPSVNLMYVTGIGSTSYQLPNFLTARKSYSWWVRSRNSYGFTTWSSPATFIAKARVVSSAPLGDITQIKPTFTWIALPDVVSYELWINNLTTNTMPYVQRFNLAGTSYTLDIPLKSGSRYSFSVRSKYSNGNYTLFSIGKSFRPGVPVAIAPIGSILEILPTYQWQGVESATGYELAIYDISSNPIRQLFRDTNVSGTSSMAASPLKGGRAYRWYVRAKFSDNTFSPWIYRNFVVSPLPATTITKPAAGALVVGRNPTIEWNSIASAGSYVIAVNEYVGSTQVRRYESVALSSPHTIGRDLTPEKRYAVYVRGVTTQGALGSWSKPISFTSLAVGVPGTISPAGHINKVRPVFQWTDAEQAASYDIWIDDISAKRNAILRLSGLSGTSVELATDLLPGHTYRWYVRAANGDGLAGRWSLKQNFIVDYALPVVVLSSPAVNAIVEAKPLLSWNAVAGADRYELRITDAAGRLAFHEESIASLSRMPADYLSVGGAYLWSVRARNAQNQVGPWSAARRMTVKATFTTPTALAPLTGHIVTASPNFAWKAVANAMLYQFRLTNLSMSNALVYEGASLSATEFEVPSLVLNQSHRYRWVVRAISATGISAWSAAQDFTVGTAIDAPFVTAPIGDTVLRPTITWAAVSGVSQYQVYVVDRTTGGLILNKRGVAGSSFTFLGNLVKNHTYRVLIRGIDGAKNGEWSVPRDFIPR